MSSTFGILKPDLVSCPPLFKQVVHSILNSHLRVHRAACLQIQRSQAIELYKEHEGNFYYNRLLRIICSGPVILMELKSVDAEKNVIRDWRKMIGPSKFLKGFGQNDVDRKTFRWQYALSDVRNTAHGADSEESAQRELAIFDTFLKEVNEDQLKQWSQMRDPSDIDELDKTE